jgi:hypothetical protein
VPAYDARRFVLELRADAPRLVAPSPNLLKGARAETEAALFQVRPLATGIAALDQLDARFGVLALEPMFRGETVPDPSSGLEDLTRFYIVSLPAGADLPGALEAYATLPEVASAEPVPLVPVAFTPNDPIAQWHLNQANDHDSDVFEAWDTFKGDTTIVLAIIDTGVLYMHEDLGGTAAPYTAGKHLDQLCRARRHAGSRRRRQRLHRRLPRLGLRQLGRGRAGRGPGHGRQRSAGLERPRHVLRGDGRCAHQQRRRHGRARIQVEDHACARRMGQRDDRRGRP